MGIEDYVKKKDKIFAWVLNEDGSRTMKGADFVETIYPDGSRDLHTSSGSLHDGPPTKGGGWARALRQNLTEG